jgi:hypothetical protein
MTLIAVDPTANMAAIAVGGNTSNVYLVQASATPTLLLTLQSASAGAFGTDGTLYLADGSAGQLWAIADPSGSANTRRLPPLQGAVARPIAIAAQGDLLYIAGSDDNRIRVYSLVSFENVNELELDCAPSTLQPFTTTSFLVNARRNPTDPVLLLQTAPVPSVLFIPSGANQ